MCFVLISFHSLVYCIFVTREIIYEIRKSLFDLANVFDSVIIFSYVFIMLGRLKCVFVYIIVTYKVVINNQTGIGVKLYCASICLLDTSSYCVP